MKMKHVYLILCIAGVILPYSQLVPFMLENGVDMVGLFAGAFATRSAAFFGMDLMVTGVTFIVFYLVEGRRLGMKHLWLPIAAVGTVGISLGLPLFLYMRELHVERT